MCGTRKLRVHPYSARSLAHSRELYPPRGSGRREKKVDMWLTAVGLSHIYIHARCLMYIDTYIHNNGASSPRTRGITIILSNSPNRFGLARFIARDDVGPDKTTLAFICPCTRAGKGESGRGSGNSRAISISRFFTWIIDRTGECMRKASLSMYGRIEKSRGSV